MPTDPFLSGPLHTLHHVPPRPVSYPHCLPVPPPALPGSPVPSTLTTPGHVHLTAGFRRHLTLICSWSLSRLPRPHSFPDLLPPLWLSPKLNTRGRPASVSGELRAGQALRLLLYARPGLDPCCSERLLHGRPQHSPWCTQPGLVSRTLGATSLGSGSRHSPHPPRGGPALESPGARLSKTAPSPRGQGKKEHAHPLGSHEKLSCSRLKREDRVRLLKMMAK